jgi:hypothetical protein
VADEARIDPAVEKGAQLFAARLIDTLQRALPPDTPVGFRISAKPTPRSGVNAVVSQVEDLGIPISVDGTVVFRLVATFECRASPTSTFLTVEDSTFKVFVIDSNQPLFTLDYRRDSRGNVPSAHYNLHAKRDDMTRALKKAGNRARGKIRRKEMAEGKTPRMGDLHFPVGSHRFRPCLEDVLEMLIVEFGADRTNDALYHLAAGRREWRRRQLAAAVSDDPATAATELQRLGYTIANVLDGLSERIERTSRI